MTLEDHIPFLFTAVVLVVVILLAKRQAIRSLEATHAQNMVAMDAQMAGIMAWAEAERTKTRAAPAAPIGRPEPVEPVSAEQWSRGKLDTESEFRPPIAADCGGWAEVAPPHLELTLTLLPDTDTDTVNRIFDKLTTLVRLLGEMDVGHGGKGLTLDAGRSGVRPGPAVGLVLTPNDAAGAAGRLWTLAQFLTTATSEYPNKVQVVARVVSAVESERHEIAA